MKQVMLRKSHLKLLKFSKLNTIDYQTTTDDDQSGAK
jgi:hypothetical protein